MSSEVEYLPSSTQWEDERVVSNKQALDDELLRRKTGASITVADVYYSSMPREMEQEACTLAASAIQSFNTEQEIAQFVKESFDNLYGKAWQCICGKHFGSYVTFRPDRAVEVKPSDYEQDTDTAEQTD